MIEIGRASQVEHIYRDLDFPNQLLHGIEINLIQRFVGLEQWNSANLQRRIELRKGILVHERKIDLESTDFFDYFETVILFVDLSKSFLDETLHLFESKEEILKMNDSMIHLFRLHTLLYCELYAIHEFADIRKIKHVLFNDLIDPIFNALRDTPYFKHYNLGRIESLNKKIQGFKRSI
jgi:hypothetical protein